jgi:hypothetical protein
LVQVIKAWRSVLASDTLSTANIILFLHAHAERCSAEGPVQQRLKWTLCSTIVLGFEASRNRSSCMVMAYTPLFL